MPNNQDGEVRAGKSRAWPMVLAAAATFCLLAAMPVILPALHLQLHARAAKSSHGITLLPAPSAPRPVSLPLVAQPIDPSQPPASFPAVSGTREAAAVSAEDGRIRIILHDASRLYQPEVIPTRGALPTLILTAGQNSYTAADLAQYGALVRLPHDAALLLDNVFVSANARLSLGGSGLRTLYLDSNTGGFASIVAWDGNLSFQGTARQPMTIRSWDRAVSTPAADLGAGRPYIREVGGRMTLSNVRVSDLGFWSGRTGGVAWTGYTKNPSTGGATNSTFTDDTYGAFLTRGSGVTFRDDLFEFNELDGLHIHRYSVNSLVVSSSASRNGGAGFVVAPATQATVLEDDVSEHNAGNGYFINGKPLATGASASGGSVAPGSGTVVKDSTALGNGKIGILVEGGTGTVIEGDEVCSTGTGIAVRYGVTNAVLTGNDIRCGPRSGLSIGPSTPGLMISGNTVVGSRTGVLVRSSGPVELDNNRITGATVFGVSARGASSMVRGVGNTISGTGFRAIDARADASAPALSASNTSGWTYHARVTFWSYLLFHPLAALWLGILALVFLAWAWSHRRRLPAHPYPQSTRWRGAASSTPPAEPAPMPVPALARAAPWGTGSESEMAADWAAEPLLVGVATSAGDAVSSGATAWAGETTLTWKVGPAPAPWTTDPTEPFPVTAGPGHVPNGRLEPGNGLSQPGYGYRWPTGHRREPRNSPGTLGSSERKTIGMPPWGPVQDPEPGDQGTYFDVFTPLPGEVDRL